MAAACQAACTATCWAASVCCASCTACHQLSRVLCRASADGHCRSSYLVWVKDAVASRSSSAAGQSVQGGGDLPLLVRRQLGVRQPGRWACIPPGVAEPWTVSRRQLPHDSRLEGNAPRFGGLFLSAFGLA